MELRLCFDTTFLIDLQKEKGAGPAHDFLAEHGNATFHWSVISVGEFAEGFEVADDPLLVRYLALATTLEVTRETALTYGRLTRELRRRGNLIGTNDLWIASHALQHGLRLVTANPAHFRRIPSLQLIGY